MTERVRTLELKEKSSYNGNPLKAKEPYKKVLALEYKVRHLMYREQIYKKVIEQLKDYSIVDVTDKILNLPRDVENLLLDDLQVYQTNDLNKYIESLVDKFKKDNRTFRESFKSSMSTSHAKTGKFGSVNTEETEEDDA